MAKKKPSKSYNTKTKPSARSKSNGDAKKIIAVLSVLLIIVLIIAIILISFRGLWKELIDTLKDFLTMQNTPSGDVSGDNNKKPIPSGVAQLNGDILEMRVLDIGQGDCILLLFPDGQVMVMDIGSEFRSTSPWTVIDGALKELEITTIDYLFLTHTDYDHVRETKKLADNYQIKNFYLPRAYVDTSATWRNSYNAALNETYIEDGQVKKAVIKENVGAYEIRGENWVMKCFSFDESDYPEIDDKASAEEKNAVSPMCLLEYADRTIVLTGDSNEKSEKYLINKGYFDDVDADVLKVGHHGSKSSTMPEFLDKVDCEYAIISCGAGNSYGHPTPEVLARLANYRDVIPDGDYDGFAQIYRTDEDGTVSVQIDEQGVINLIADENQSKNTTTGTPINELESGDIREESIVMFAYWRQNYFYV